MPHVVLLGDSVFDNAAYVPRGPPVLHQLRAAVPKGWSASLGAVDGNVTSDVVSQLGRLPSDASHLVVSVGGNDALMVIDILRERARSVAEVLGRFGVLGRSFEKTYSSMLGAVIETGLPSAVCTIYYPNPPDAAEREVMIAGLATFNDVILRAAFERGIPVIDLRLVCTTPEDYANPIEPSETGGAKIARAVARLITEHDFTRRVTGVYR